MNTKSGLLIWLSVYWSLMLLISNVLALGLVNVDFEKDISEEENTNWFSNITDVIIGFVPDFIVPLLNIMWFKVNYGVPYFISIFTNIVGIITVIAIYDFFVNSLFGG